MKLVSFLLHWVELLIGFYLQFYPACWLPDSEHHACTCSKLCSHSSQLSGRTTAAHTHPLTNSGNNWRSRVSRGKNSWGRGCGAKGILENWWRSKTKTFFDKFYFLALSSCPSSGLFNIFTSTTCRGLDWQSPCSDPTGETSLLALTGSPIKLLQYNKDVKLCHLLQLNASELIFRLFDSERKQTGTKCHGNTTGCFITCPC